MAFVFFPVAGRRTAVGCGTMVSHPGAPRDGQPRRSPETLNPEGSRTRTRGDWTAASATLRRFTTCLPRTPSGAGRLRMRLRCLCGTRSLQGRGSCGPLVVPSSVRALWGNPRGTDTWGRCVREAEEFCRRFGVLRGSGPLWSAELAGDGCVSGHHSAALSNVDNRLCALLRKEWANVVLSGVDTDGTTCARKRSFRHKKAFSWSGLHL